MLETVERLLPKNERKGQRIAKRIFQLIHSSVFDMLNAVCKNGDSASSVEKQTRLWLKRLNVCYRSFVQRRTFKSTRFPAKDCRVQIRQCVRHLKLGGFIQRKGMLAKDTTKHVIATWWPSLENIFNYPK